MELRFAPYDLASSESRRFAQRASIRCARLRAALAAGTPDDFLPGLGPGLGWSVFRGAGEAPVANLLVLDYVPENICVFVPVAPFTSPSNRPEWAPLETLEPAFSLLCGECTILLPSFAENPLFTVSLKGEALLGTHSKAVAERLVDRLFACGLRATTALTERTQERTSFDPWDVDVRDWTVG